MKEEKLCTPNKCKECNLYSIRCSINILDAIICGNVDYLKTSYKIYCEEGFNNSLFGVNSLRSFDCRIEGIAYSARKIWQMPEIWNNKKIVSWFAERSNAIVSYILENGISNSNKETICKRSFCHKKGKNKRVEINWQEEWKKVLLTNGYNDEEVKVFRGTLQRDYNSLKSILSKGGTLDIWFNINMTREEAQKRQRGFNPIRTTHKRIKELTSKMTKHFEAIYRSEKLGTEEVRIKYTDGTFSYNNKPFNIFDDIIELATYINFLQQFDTQSEGTHCGT